MLYRNLIKPLADIFIAVLLLIVASPVMILIIVLLKISGHRQLFFTQKRPGYRERIFSVYKFRTMTSKTDSHGQLLPDEKRLTRLGKFLRKSSLDELPQLINVLKGDMSLVGPRPLLPEYLPLYNDEQRKRHLVKPGITGWAQVNGRNAISWKQKFELDTWYVLHQSFLLDFRILWLTLLKVISAKDINQEGSATTEWFNGNN